MLKWVTNLFFEKKDSRSLKELLRKDLAVCAIRFNGNRVEPRIRYWSDETGSYVGNPTDINAALLHAISMSKRSEGEQNLRWHRF